MRDDRQRFLARDVDSGAGRGGRVTAAMTSSVTPMPATMSGTGDRSDTSG